VNEYYEKVLPHLGNDPLWGPNTVRRWPSLLNRDDGRETADRHALVDRYGWAIPTDEAIAALVELSPLVEIGAGRGYWAHLLRQAGADTSSPTIASLTAATSGTRVGSRGRRSCGAPPAW
jgi:hypothetical protein